MATKKNQYRAQPTDTIDFEAAMARGDELMANIKPVEQAKQGAGFFRTMGDMAIKGAQGVVDLGASAVGLGNIATGGLVGDGMGAMGYDPKRTNLAMGEYLSQAQKDSDAKVQNAQGFLETVGQAATEPRFLAGSVMQSLPGLLAMGGAQGAVARSIAGKAALSTAEGAAASIGLSGSEALTAALSTQAGGSAAKAAIQAAEGKLIALGAASEGAQTAGGIAQEAQQAGRTWDQYAPAALGAGAMTAAIGYGAGKIMGDAGTRMFTGADTKLTGSLPMNMAKSGFSEGVLEEMPQSSSEQAFRNLAMGESDLMKGVPNAAGAGLVTGAAMGLGFGAMGGSNAKTPQQAEADTIRAAELVPESGAMTRAANAGTEAKARSVESMPTASITGADPAQMLQDQAEGGNPFMDRLNQPREDLATSSINLDKLAQTTPPLDEQNATRILNEEKLQGHDFTLAPHPQGGYMVVPRLWVTPELSSAAEADAADFLGLVDTERRDQQVMQAQVDQEHQKQAEIEAAFAAKPEQDAETAAVEQAATIDAPNAMQAAFNKLADKTIGPEPEAPPVTTKEPRIVARTPGMKPMPLELAELQVSMAGGEVARVQNANGKFGYVVVPKPAKPAKITAATAKTDTGMKEGDTLNSKGKPFTNFFSANTQATKQGEGFEPVKLAENAFVVRSIKTNKPLEQDGQSAPAIEAIATKETQDVNQAPQAVQAEAQGQAAPAAEVVPIAEAQADALIKVADLYGKSHHVKQSALDGASEKLPLFDSKGARAGGSILRENLDPTGEKLAALNKENRDNPLFDVITTKMGNPFLTKMAAARELKVRALGDTHEVVAADTVKPGAVGFFVQKKAVAQPAQPATSEGAGVSQPTQVAAQRTSRADLPNDQKPDATEQQVSDEMEAQYQQSVKEAIQARLGKTPVDTEATQKKTPFKAFLQQHGIAPVHTSDIAGRNRFKANNMLPATFRKGGLDLDSLVERAIERGFMTEADRGDQGKLISMIQSEIAGDAQVSTEFADEDAAAQTERAQRMEIEGEADKMGLPYSTDTRADILASMVKRVATRLAGEPVGTTKAQRIIERAKETVARIERKRAKYDTGLAGFANATISEQDAALDVQFDEDGNPVIVRMGDIKAVEAWLEENQQWDNGYGTDTRANQDSGQDGPPVATAEEKRDRPTETQLSEAQPGSPAAPAGQPEEGLTAPAREDVLATQASAEAAAKAEKAKKRADDEVARRAQERKDIAHRSESAADTFELGQDPLQSLSGQGGIFDEPAHVPTKAEIPSPKSEAVQENGDFGPTLTQYRHDAQGAIKALTELQGGDAVAALHHPEVGDIDLAWGEAGTAAKEYEDGHGLAKISIKHPEVLKDLQGFLLRLHKDNEQSGKNRIRLVDDKGTAVVRLQWNGSQKIWLLTAFENEVSPAADGGRTGVSTNAETATPAEQGAGSSMSVAQPALQGKPAKIVDSGQVLEGARKLYAKAYAAKMDEGAGMDTAAVPLSKSWPEPDYQRLLDDGADPWAVAMARAMREEVPTKPSSWKIKAWVRKVESLRAMTNDVMSGAMSKEKFKATGGQFNLADWFNKIDLYEAMGHEKSLKTLKFSLGEYGMYGGQTFSPAKKLWTINMPGASNAASWTHGNWGNDLVVADTKAEAIEKFKVWSAAQVEKAPTEAKATSFDIYSYKSKPGIIIVGKRLGASKSVDLKEFTTSKEARAYIANNQAELERLLAAAKFEQPERGESNAPRVGDDHRGGADVTSEQFRDAFGFRGEQFGASMPQGERQANMNQAYDALMDLAGVVGIEPKALSLNGELGLAFGARGHGGKNPAAAHYERDTTGAVTPNRVVINLTRKNGAGSLAHEWFHAVDNYFARMRGEKAGMLTESYTNKGEGVRAEMVDAFKRVIMAIQSSGARERSKRLDKKRVKDYWSTGLEMAARSFESYVIAKLQDKNGSNDYLANIVPEALYTMQGSYPYPVMGEMPAIRAAFDNFFNVVQTKETEQGVAMFSRSKAGPDGKSDVLSKDGKFKGWPERRSWTRQEYSDVVSLLPKTYRGDAHRLEPVATKDWDALAAAALPDLEALNEVSGAGTFRLDDLGNILVDERKSGRDAIVEDALPIAKKYGLGIFITGIRTESMPYFTDAGFVSEMGLGAVLARSTGSNAPVVPMASGLINNPTYGTMMSYKPRGFPGPMFARSGSPTRGLPTAQVTSIIDAIRARWGNAPEIIVAANVADSVIPQRVRDYDQTQKSQGATGEPEGFYYKGKVYLVADQLGDANTVMRVLFHEVLGHVGLRGVFGDKLDGILKQLVGVRRPLVTAKAAEYGLDMAIEADRLTAAEEVLAVMAEKHPEIGFVKRAIALIRGWLRANVPGFSGMKMTDADIITQFILPARRFVEQGGGGGGPKGTLPVMSRSQDQATNPNAMFSRTTINTITRKVTDTLGETFSHPGKMSWWDKSVGSMYHLAERSAPFKRVFDSAQSFINDVSFYATEAADLAPKILPKLDTWGDLLKNPITAKDNTAISAPILQGTLSWVRDETGKAVPMDELAKRYEVLTDEAKAQMLLKKHIVTADQLKRWKASPLDIYTGAVRNRFEATFQKAGVVWTNAELTSIFNLTPDQIGLYREFRTATDKSLDNLAKADLLRYGGKDVDYLRELVMEAPDADSAAVMLRDHLLKLAGFDIERADTLTASANGMIDRGDKVAKLKKEGYAPLSRFGRYSVDVVVDGERQYFSLFESARAANQMAAKLKGEFGVANVVQGTLSEREFEQFQGITPESLELFGNMMGLDSTGSEASDKAFQTYVKLTKSNRSAMKRMIHRKGTAGFSDDMGRVLAAFVYSNARQTSAALHMGELGDAVNAIPKGEGELKDHAIGLADYIKKPREEAQALRGMLFAQYLGGSIASAFVNFTQPLSVSFPYLSQYGGAAKSAAALVRAMADQRAGKVLEVGLAEALKIAEEQGVVSPQSVHQLMAQAQGSASLNVGDGTRVGDAKAIVGNNFTKLALGWGKLFGIAEQVNRRSTFIAAYRIAVEQKIKNPAAFATKAVDETQFINNKANKARFARGAIGATLMTFKSYSLNYLELLYRMSTQNGPEGKKAALMMLGMLVLMAGVGGLPFADDLDDLVDFLAQRMGYNFSTKKAKQEFLQDVFGKAGADFVDKGITGLPGSPIDVSGRLSMANMIPGTGLLLKKADHTRDLAELAGPAGDLVKRAFQAGDQVLSGEFGKAAMTIAPKAIGNLDKGVDMANTGMYRDAKGMKVMDTTPTEAAMKMIGFQPASVAGDQEANQLRQVAKNFYSLTAADIRARWANGLFNKDPEAVQAARQAMRNWNEKNPDQLMVANMPAILRRVREMHKTKDQRIADSAPKSMRAAMRKEIASEQADRRD